jgi:mRNA interferase MazF
MTIYESFAVVDVPFPFIDSSRQKRRPALVLSSRSFQKGNNAIILAMITSAERRLWEYDVALADWREAGLKKSCVLRWKIFTLDSALIAGLRGRLSDRDRVAVSKVFAEVLSFDSSPAIVLKAAP